MTLTFKGAIEYARPGTSTDTGMLSRDVIGPSRHWSDNISRDDVQESRVCSPIPAAIISVEPIGIVQLLHVKLAFAYKVVVAAHDSSQRAHKARYLR